MKDFMYCPVTKNKPREKPSSLEKLQHIESIFLPLVLKMFPFVQLLARTNTNHYKGYY